MRYATDVEFQPLYELMNSLHTYLCRKFYKKIELSPNPKTPIRFAVAPPRMRSNYQKTSKNFSTERFVDRLTHGLVFEKMPGLERLLLIPQYRFQPVNVIYYYGKLTICHYASDVHFEHSEEGLSAELAAYTGSE